MTSQSSHPDIFQAETVAGLVARMDKLTPKSQAQWGKMNVAQMLAHCSKPYQQALEGGIKGPPIMMKLLVKWFFKKSMTNEVPYKQNLPTNPSFVIVGEKEFEDERNKLKNYIQQFSAKGRPFFDGKEQATLGKLSAHEWNAMMYKHLDHHFRQFGV